LSGLDQLTIVGGELRLTENLDLVEADLPGLEARVASLVLRGHAELEFFGTGDLMDISGPVTVAQNGTAAPFLNLDLYFVRRIRGHADFNDNAGWAMDRSLPCCARWVVWPS